MVEDAQFVQKKNENQDILQKRMITFYQRKCQILLLIGIMIKILYLQTIILLLVIKKFGGSALRNMNLVLKLANLQKVKDVQFAQGKKIVQGINDIFTLVPKLKQEWDFEKNHVAKLHLLRVTFDKVFSYLPYSLHNIELLDRFFMHKMQRKKKCMLML